jgi:hypothetical protein
MCGNTDLRGSDWYTNYELMSLNNVFSVLFLIEFLANIRLKAARFSIGLKTA